MLSWKLSVLEIPLDKELTANCLVETRTKLEELIPLRWLNMVWIGYISPWSSPWLMVSHGMVCLGPQWSANICKVCWGRVELQSRGHNSPKITCGFFFLCVCVFHSGYIFSYSGLLWKVEVQLQPKFGSKMQQGLLCVIMSSNVAHQGQNYTENVKLV